MIGTTVGTVRSARLALPDAPFVDPGPVDVFLADGRIADIAPAGALPPRGETLDADGAWILPGLWDHHVHVVPWALTAERIDLGSVESARHAAAVVGAAPVRGGRRIGVGFRDAFWPDRTSLELLDAATGGIPAYLVNADVHSVWLNSAAFTREGITPQDDGMLREEAAFEISRRLNAADPRAADDAVSEMARAAAARGVVGIVDLDMTWNEDAWQRRASAGFDLLRVRFGTYPEHLDRAIGLGLRAGDVLRGAPHDLVRVGPLKIITDGSLGTRTAACSHPYPHDPHDRGLLTVEPALLTELMMRATGAGLHCAIHAIGDIANAQALDAFAATGAQGTIEHAQLVAHADIPRFARLGVGASVQPGHALDDRDLTDSVWGAQTAVPYPLRSLADAGATLLFGSDAPVSILDPWTVIADAVFRTRGDREPWRPHERLAIETALAASTVDGSTDPARVEPGAVADLVLCAADPMQADEAGLRAMDVRATLLGGRITHSA